MERNKEFNDIAHRLYWLGKSMNENAVNRYLRNMAKTIGLFSCSFMLSRNHFNDEWHITPCNTNSEILLKLYEDFITEFELSKG